MSCFTAEMIPRGTAATKAIRMAITASCRVMGNRSFSSSITGDRYQVEVPRSPRRVFQSQSAYWM